MDRKCSIEGCPGDPQYQCKCEASLIYVCNNHMVDHLMSNTLVNHNISPIYWSIEELNYLEIAKSKLIETKTREISEIVCFYAKKISELNEEFRKRTETVKKNVENVLSRIEKVIAHKHVEKGQDDELITNLLHAIRSGKIDEMIWNMILLPERQMNERKLWKSSTPMSYVGRLSTYCKPFLTILGNETFIRKIDLITRNFKKVQFQFTSKIEKIDSYMSLCPISSDSYFYIGKENIYLLKHDPENVFILSNDTHNRTNFMPLLVYDCIYAFGGFMKQRYHETTLSSRFLLGINQWEQIRELPRAAYNTSTVLYGKKILLTGEKLDAIYQYDEQLNTYIEIFNVANVGPKLLLSNEKGDIYLLSAGKIYLSQNYNVGYWKAVGNYRGKIEPPFSRPDYYKNLFYFCANKQLIYFDTTDFSLECIQISES